MRAVMSWSQTVNVGKRTCRKWNSISARSLLYDVGVFRILSRAVFIFFKILNLSLITSTYKSKFVASNVWKSENNVTSTMVWCYYYLGKKGVYVLSCILKEEHNKVLEHNSRSARNLAVQVQNWILKVWTRSQDYRIFEECASNLTGQQCNLQNRRSLGK